VANGRPTSATTLRSSASARLPTAHTRAERSAEQVGSAEVVALEHYWSTALQTELSSLDPRVRYSTLLDRFEAFNKVRAVGRQVGRKPAESSLTEHSHTAPSRKPDSQEIVVRPKGSSLPLSVPPSEERRPWSPAVTGRYEGVHQPLFQSSHLWPMSSRRLAEQKFDGKRRAS